MHCQNCGNKIKEDDKFCGSCGSKQKETKSDDSSSAKGKGGHWLWWWKIDEEELNKEVTNYESLGNSSARAVATWFMLFSAGLTLVMIWFSLFGIDSSGYVDVLLFLFLAFFTYKGKKWAMVAAMVLWTLEKGYTMIAFAEYHTTPIVSIIWWAIYMHAFWLAYKVEVVRTKKINLSS